MTLQQISSTRRAFLAGSGLIIGLALAPRSMSAFAAPRGVKAGGEMMLMIFFFSFCFFFLLFLFFLLFSSYTYAQCAMCRASVENNVSNGDTTIGAGLNMGILYLFAMPYLIAGIIGYLWFRNAKKRKSKFIFQGEKF